MSKHTINNQVQALKLSGERVTRRMVNATITSTMYLNPVGSLTICVLSLQNGFTVTGESACASPEDYNKAIGERIAREDAYRKIRMLEGYALRERLHNRDRHKQAKAQSAINSLIASSEQANDSHDDHNLQDHGDLD